MAVAVATGLRAASFEEFVATLYRPLQAEMLALSPDGKKLAYSRHEKGEVAIYIMAVDQLEKKFKISVQDDHGAMFSREKVPASLRFMAWSSPTRLVFAPTPYKLTSWVAPIFAVNSDGSDPKTLTASDDFAITVPSSNGQGAPSIVERPVTILGFAPGNRRGLLVQALGNPTARPPISTTVSAIDVATGKIKELSEEYEDAPMTYDPFGNVRILYRHPPYATTRGFHFKIPGIWDRWVAMDEVWGGPTAKSFVVTTKNYYGQRAFPVGVDTDPNLIYYASNIGRDTFGIYALDIRTKQRTPLAIEDPHIDLAGLNPDDARKGLVLDEYTGRFVGVRAKGVTPITRWIDPQLAALQIEFDQKFPQRAVEILQWDEARTRFLIKTTSGQEPGRYFVALQSEKAFVEVMRAAPWLRSADLSPGRPFEFDTPGGVHLSGYLTFPRRPRLNPPPLLIDFGEGVGAQVVPGFDKDAQILADMGFIVARVNFRGMTGFGLAHREALRTGGDRAPVEDAVAAVEWIAARYALDRKRVATIGRKLGGYLALRALQLKPEIFRCGVATDAPLSPSKWVEPPVPFVPNAIDGSAEISTTNGLPPPTAAPPIDFAKEALRDFLLEDKTLLPSILQSVDSLTKPVMLIVNVEPGDEIAQQNYTLNSRLKSLHRDPTYVEAKSADGAMLPAARAKTFRDIEEFFNLNLYDFKVKVGPTKELK